MFGNKKRIEILELKVHNLQIEKRTLEYTIDKLCHDFYNPFKFKEGEEVVIRRDNLLVKAVVYSRLCFNNGTEKFTKFCNAYNLKIINSFNEEITQQYFEQDILPLSSLSKICSKNES